MDREVILVLGKTGYGKSVWSKAYTKSLPRFLLYDLAQEYPVRYYTGDGIADLLNARERIEKLPALVREHASPIAKRFRIGVWKREDAPFVGALAFMEGRCTVCFEEFSTLYSRGAVMADYLSEIVFLGRHRSVSVVGTAQRAASVPIDLRSQATRVVCFNQTEHRDMDWLEDSFGEHTDDISSLARLECLDAYRGEVRRYSIASFIGASPETADRQTA